MNPKQWLYNLHKYTIPNPESAKWLVPLYAGGAAYLGHKALTNVAGAGTERLGGMIQGIGLKKPGAAVRNIGQEFRKSNPLLFAAAVTALSGALAQGVYRPGATNDKSEMKDWDSFFFDKKAAYDPMLTAAAALEQGWQHDPLIKAEVKRHRWMTPSVNSRRLKETIWDTPGFTPGQKEFLRDSVDGAIVTANNPDLLSMNDLGIGAQRAIVNKAQDVPSLLGTALKATARAAEGAFIGRGLGVLLGGTPKTVRFMQNTGLVTGVFNTSDVMKKIKSYF